MTPTARDSPAPRPMGLILAGGRGSRLGGARKAEFLFEGRRLIDICLEAFAPHCAGVIVSTGPDGQRAAAPSGTIALPDPPGAPGGPLAGLAAAALYYRDRPPAPDLLVTIAVDTPLLPQTYVPWMVENLPPDAGAGYVNCLGSPYPTNAIWRRAALESLRALLGSPSPPTSPRAALETLGARALVWPAPEGIDPFASLNTFADLAALTRDAPTRR